MPFQKLNVFSKKVSDLSDKPNETMTTAQVKAQFDAAPEEVRLYLNQLIDVLQSTEIGDSGADNIKLTPIDTSPDTIRGALIWLKEQINVAQLGQITDGSITDEKLSNEAGNIKQRLNDFNTFIEEVNTFMASKGKGLGLAPTDAYNKIPVAYLPISEMKVASNNYPRSLSRLSFDNKTTGNNVPTNGAGNWFTLMELTENKERGWSALELGIDEVFYTNSLTGKTGTAFANQVRISINGEVVDETDEIIAMGTTVSLASVEANKPITLKIEIKQPIGTTQTYAYSAITAKTNEVFNIVL